MGAVMPIASAYGRYVSIEATTTRASTVIRSMPTSDTRTHASITIPLSRTRSRTSMRLVPPGARSTGGMSLAYLLRGRLLETVGKRWSWRSSSRMRVSRRAIAFCVSAGLIGPATSDRESDWRSEKLEKHESSRSLATLDSHHRRPLQLQPDGHEVVRRPRAGVAERELALVARGDFLHFGVEDRGRVALDQERGVHDHPLANWLVGPRGDRRVAQILVDLAHVGVGFVGQRLLDHAPELHAREVRRGLLVLDDLLFEPADVLIIPLHLGQHLVAVPIHLETEFELVLHLLQHVAQGVVGVLEELNDVLLGLEERAEAHRHGREAALDDRLVDVRVGQHVLARR